VRHTFAISTFGCKVNQCDSQQIRERLIGLGWREVPLRDPAELYVVNTCAVTALAVKKARRAVRRAMRRNPAARVIVTGCAAISDPEQFALLDGVCGVLTREQMLRADRFISADVRPPAAAPVSIGDPIHAGIDSFGHRTRAFLRIQEGCNAACAYCIVPAVRGRERSRPLPDIRREAQRLLAAGHVEIVLTGIHIGRYGLDLPGRPRLVDAIRCVLDVAGIQRLRLSSIEAIELTDELLDVMASDRRVCPHLHLPLQSGDDALLAAMNRRYTAGRFLEQVRHVKERLERPAITTDVIVGFPGETEAQFENTLAACRDAGFSRIHIFPFSPRPGTPASTMPGRVAHEAVRDRVRRLKQLAGSLATDYAGKFVGEVVFPLVERRPARRPPGEGRLTLTGWTERYLRAEFVGSPAVMGRIVPLRVTASNGARLRGELAENAPAAGDQSSVSATS